MARRITKEEMAIKVTYRRTSRLSMRIVKNGDVHVSAPIGMPREKVMAFIEEHKDWINEAKYQFLLHIKYLHCQKTGLWYHGWTFEGRHHFGEAFWGRGNSWFTAGAADFIGWLPEGDPVRRCVLETWKEQCRELKRLQDPETGLWHTLLDDPDSYLETSATAAIAYGLHKGWRTGLLGEEYREAAVRAADGVRKKIAADGTVEGVSYGTPMGMDLDFYRKVPLQATAYGQGLAYLMFMEMGREKREC